MNLLNIIFKSIHYRNKNVELNNYIEVMYADDFFNFESSQIIDKLEKTLLSLEPGRDRTEL